MAVSEVTLRQLAEMAGARFIVPIYQRRYVWGETNQDGENAASFLTECLLSAYEKSESYFLQGLTVVKRDGCFELVDGQQRITYLYLLLKTLLPTGHFFRIHYQMRPQAQQWLDNLDSDTDIAINEACDSEDIYNFKKTLSVIKDANIEFGVDYVLDNVRFLCINLDKPDLAIGTFDMMNGTKSPMNAPDLIKADIMRMACDDRQPNYDPWNCDLLRSQYATEWDNWIRWWNAADVAEYYHGISSYPLDLLLRLALRNADDNNYNAPLTYKEARRYIENQESKSYHSAKHFFGKLRRIQKRFEESFSNAETYNRIRAILLLQNSRQDFVFLHHYFVEQDIDAQQLDIYYKLSFLSMTIDEIMCGEPSAARFYDMLANISMVDVYHSDAKRDVFSLLLRLNIDEDIKLGRKFDFSIWNNRSLEHIYSKSKVWHLSDEGQPLDGNDNPINLSVAALQRSREYLRRDMIVNHDGVQLSEHCIGNLVLLYGQNNATFGNTGFDEKKMMFLTPGDLSVFKSRNLLHSVCVFAGNSWSAQSIVDNYNLTIKNLKIYYGYK